MHRNVRAYEERVPRLSVRKRKLPLQRRQRESERLYMHRAVPVVRRMVFGTLAQNTKKRTELAQKRITREKSRFVSVLFLCIAIYKILMNLEIFHKLTPFEWCFVVF